MKKNFLTMLKNKQATSAPAVSEPAPQPVDKPESEEIAEAVNSSTSTTATDAPAKDSDEKNQDNGNESDAVDYEEDDTPTITPAQPIKVTVTAKAAAKAPVSTQDPDAPSLIDFSKIKTAPKTSEASSSSPSMRTVKMPAKPIPAADPPAEAPKVVTPPTKDVAESEEQVGEDGTEEGEGEAEEEVEEAEADAEEQNQEAEAEEEAGEEVPDDQPDSPVMASIEAMTPAKIGKKRLPIEPHVEKEEVAQPESDAEMEQEDGEEEEEGEEEQPDAEEGEEAEDDRPQEEMEVDEVVEEDEYGMPQAPASKAPAQKRKHQEMSGHAPSTITAKTAKFIDEANNMAPATAFNFIYEKLMADKDREAIFQSFVAATGKIDTPLFIDSLRFHDGLKHLHDYGVASAAPEESGGLTLRFTPKQILMLRWLCWYRTFNICTIPSSRSSKPGINDAMTQIMHMFILQLPSVVHISANSTAHERYLNANSEEDELEDMNALSIKEEASLLSSSVIENSSINRIIKMSQEEMFAMSSMLVENLLACGGTSESGAMMIQENMVSRMLEVLATLKIGRSPLYNAARRWFESHYSHIIMNFIRSPSDSVASDMVETIQLRKIIEDKFFVGYLYKKHLAVAGNTSKNFTRPQANKTRDMTVANNLLKMQMLALIISIASNKLEEHLSRPHYEDEMAAATAAFAAVSTSASSSKNSDDNDGNDSVAGDDAESSADSNGSSQVSAGKNSFSYKNMKDGSMTVVIQDIGTFRTVLSETVKKRKVPFGNKGKAETEYESADPGELAKLIIDHVRKVYFAMLRGGSYQDPKHQDEVTNMSKMVSNLKWVMELFKKVLFNIASAGERTDWVESTFFRVKDRLLCPNVPPTNSAKIPKSKENPKGGMMFYTPDDYLLGPPSTSPRDPNEFKDECENYAFAVPTYEELVETSQLCKQITGAKPGKHDPVSVKTAGDTILFINLLEYLACLAVCKITGNNELAPAA